MPTYVTEGVVLRRVNYGEADRIITVLTRDHGKIGLIAKGARKPGSRLAPYTDLFAHSRMQLARGRGELDVLTQAQSLDVVVSPGAAHAAAAAVCAELADSVLESHHADAEMYELTLDALRLCYSAAHNPRAVVIWYLRRTVDRLGYAPQLRHCAVCHNPLPERSTSFSAAAGGLLCANCDPGRSGEISCGIRTVKVLRVAAGGDRDLYFRLRLDEDVLAELEAVAEQEMAFHLDRRLRSFEVLREIRAKP